MPIIQVMTPAPPGMKKVARKQKKPKPAKKESEAAKKAKKGDLEPCAKTEFWSWEKLNSKDTQNFLQNLNIMSLDSLPIVGEVDN